MSGSSNVDASIIMGGQFPLYDPLKAQQYQQNRLALMQQQSAAKAQNQLAKLYQNPANVQNGMLTPNALAQVMAIDPVTGMKIEQSQAKTQDLMLKSALDQKKYIADNIATPAMESYEQQLASGATPEAAAAVAQGIYTSALSQAAQSGVFSQAQIANMSPQFNPVTLGAGLESWKDYQTQQLNQAKLNLTASNDAARIQIANNSNDIRAASAGVSAGDPASLNLSAGLASNGGAQPASGAASQKPPSGAQLYWKGKPLAAAASSSPPSPATAPPGQQPLPEVPGLSADAVKTFADAYIDSGYKTYPQLDGGNKYATARMKTAFDNAVEVEEKNRAASGGTDSADPFMDATAQGIANYQIPMPSGYTMNTPGSQALMNAVKKYNPGFTIEGARAAYAFMAGPQGNAVTSLNVGVQHLDVLSKAAAALQNGDFQTLNSLKQSFAELSGSPVPVNFDVTKQLVGDEIAKAIVGGPTAQADREKAQDIISRVNSPEQLSGAIQQIKSLMAGQLKGKREQFESSTGLPASAFNVKLDPDTVQALDSDNQDAQPAPSPGTVMDGYKFNGGDPADPKNWTKQ